MTKELNDEEFACLVMRSCGVPNIRAALGFDHPAHCGFCRGEMKAAV